MMLWNDGRIVNVSTSVGVLSYLRNEALAKNLDDVDSLSEEFLDATASKYLEDVKAGRWEQEGWNLENPQYADSKILLHAYTRFLAKTLPKSNKGVHMNVIHPGYTATDMTEKMLPPGKSSVEFGADTPVWLALLPEENYPHGEFFFNRNSRSHWDKLPQE